MQALKLMLYATQDSSPLGLSRELVSAYKQLQIISLSEKWQIDDKRKCFYLLLPLWLKTII